MLVALRLVIGWHFFKEGSAHRHDPTWSSEGFLKQAKGPLAEKFQSVVPDFHGWTRLMLAPLDDAKAEEAVAKDAAAAKAAAKEKDKTLQPPTICAEWLTAANDDWKTELAAWDAAYGFDTEQKKTANEILADTNRRMVESLTDNEPDIRLYRQLVSRAQAMGKTPGGSEIPNIVARAAAVRQNPLGEKGIVGPAPALNSPPPAWLADAKQIEQSFHARLADLLTEKQAAMASPEGESARLHRIDAAVTWLLIIAGGCLIVGLFTRLAAVAGALFLLSVILTQPPWAVDTVPTYNQVVECVALLALATTPVGRWGGLDWFIHRLFVSPCCAAEGKQKA